MTVEVVVFDLDGTLIDSAPIVGSILNEMREERQLPPLAVEHYREWSSVGGTKMVQQALAISGDVSMHLTEFRRRYSCLPTPLSSVYPGVHETLRSLNEQRIGMAICTNKPEALAQKVLIETGMRGYFHSVVGGDTTRRNKPHRDPLDLTLKNFIALPSAAIMVGDSSIDQRTAKAAAIPFIFFASGYDNTVSDYDFRISEIAGVTGILHSLGAADPRFAQVEPYG